MLRLGVRAWRRGGVAVAIVGVWFAALPLAGGAAASTMALVPHRAIYDLTLARAEPSTSMVAAAGRLVFEINGSACEGYSVDFRNVTRVTDRDGVARVTDMRSTTRETISPPTLDFDHQTFVEGTLATEVAGLAEAKASGVSVEVRKPKETSHSLARAIFPTAHTRLILDAAAEGERILEASVYDGGDEASTVYETATVIGPRETGLPGASDAEKAALAEVPGVMEMGAWRLVISYFQAGGADGERSPEYELTFTLLENGISYDVSFNYGAFTLAGDLTELNLGTMRACAPQ